MEMYTYSEDKKNSLTPNKIDKDLPCDIDFFVKNLNLIHYYINKNLLPLIRESTITYDDLFQEGALALLNSLSSYNGEKGAKFSTYFFFQLKHHFTKYKRNHQNLIRIPNHIYDKYNLYNNSSCELNQKKLKEIIEIFNKYYSTYPLDEVITKIDLKTEDPLVVNERFSRLNSILDSLPEIEKTVLRFRYGFHNQVEYTYKEIGERLNLSPTWIKNIEKKALKKIEKLF